MLNAMVDRGTRAGSSGSDQPRHPPCRFCGKTAYFFMGDDICLDCKDMGFDNPEELLEAFRKLRREHPEWFDPPRRGD